MENGESIKENENKKINKEGKIIYGYDEAMKKCMEYFNEDELASSVWLNKYALHDNEGNLLEETPDQMHRRVAKELARVEKNKFKDPMPEDEIFSYLDHFKYIVPQGGGLSGIGNNYQYMSLANCYVVSSPLDSYGSICKTDEELVQISKRRGGNGLDISNLRPIGTPTTNASRSSTGIIPFCERFSNSINECCQGGRRGALLISLSIHHPQVLEFARSKIDLKKITGANISIRLTDDFLNAVKNNKEYEQKWPVDSENPVISKKVDARDIWQSIIESAWLCAEPGLLFWDNIIKESPADCYSEFGFKSVSTNPCSELVLSELSNCVLLLLNLYGYIIEPFTKSAKFNFDKFYKHTQVAQRFNDNIIDLEIECIDRIIKKIKSDPEPFDVKDRELNLWKKIKKNNIIVRRTGTGSTGLGDVFAACNIKYGSEESIELAQKIFKILKLGCYRSSVDMAKELGPFEIWDHELERENPFLLRIKKDDEKLWDDMKKYGRRNIGLLTLSPAGSISLLTQSSSGIEPLFKMEYRRRKKINKEDKNIRIDFIDDNGEYWEEYFVFHKKIEIWKNISGEEDIDKSPWAGSCAEEINWENRVKLQALINKEIDHSISSTINLPEDVSKEEVAKIYESAWELGCKGITIYRQNSRSGILVDNKNNISKTKAPKRPKVLECDIYHVSVMGEKFFVLVGLLNCSNSMEPYEIFAGKDKLNISQNCKKGFIKKIKREMYVLLDEKDPNNVVCENIAKMVKDEQEVITRLISIGLRHGTDIEFLVHQLEKSEGNIQSFSKAISRVLKKYLKENSLIHGISCPHCNSEMRRVGGCPTCSFCGFSKCM